MVDTDTKFSRPGPVDAPALFGLLLVVLVCTHHALLDDGDTYTHIAAGAWMLEHRSVLTWDPFSATFAGQPWDAHEWLGEVLLGAAYRADGLTGVVLLSAAAAATAFANLARHVGRWCSWTATLLLTAAAVCCVLPSLLARPHLLALPMMELWVAGLVGARAAGRAPGWWMLGLMVIWANLHGGFAFGIALSLAFALASSLDRARWRDGIAWRWWLFIARTIGAALLTPQGLEGLLFPIRLLNHQSLALVDEWQPINLASDFVFETVVLALIALLGSGRVAMGWFRLLLLIGLLYLAIAHVRHTVLFGIAGALLLAEPVGRGFGGRVLVGSPRFGWQVCWSGVAAVMLLRLAIPNVMNDGRARPVSALAQVPGELIGTPVLNSRQFGGYLTLAGLHPFIDGRIELFGDDFVTNYVAMSGPSMLAQQVARYGLGWAIVAVGDPLVGSFEALAGWRRQYADKVAVVFVREGVGLARPASPGSGDG